MTVSRRCGAAVVTVSCLLFALWAHTETRQDFNRFKQEFNGSTQEFNGSTQKFNGSTQEFNGSTQEFNGSAAGFHRFTQKFDRQYEVSSEEFNRRLLYFQDATERHTLLNSVSTSPQSATYGINLFSDLSQQEFTDVYLRASADRPPLFSGLTTAEELKPRFDWRDQGVVAPVQDQETCGSCWAFSVVGATQSVRAIGGSPLQQLSVQQVVDCSFQNQGCNGGSPSSALDWLKKSRVKLVPRSEYPYKAKTGMCRFFSQSHDGVSVKNFTAHDFSGQEKAMMGQLVDRGPLAAVVDAVSWQDYLGGIIQHHCSSQWSNHAVLVVGYDTTGDIPYWIVQNSWGTSWGNEGYVYIKMGGNICGIADSVAAVYLT